jgi:trehalose 6-phosphate phosphatase
VNDLIARAVAVLRNRPAGLVSDFDGTLSEIAPTPADAYLHPGCRTALGALRAALELVALVSGRTAADLKAKVGLSGVLYVGLHGADWNGESSDDPVITRLAQWLKDRLGSAGQLEIKGPGLAVHYRGSADPVEARRRILGLLSDRVPPGYVLTEGKQVVEVRPACANKGEAVRRLITGFGLRGVVYLGDDLTDVDAFRAVREWRVRGGAGLTVAVAGPETPLEVTAAADEVLGSVADTCRFLNGLASRLSRRPGP